MRQDARENRERILAADEEVFGAHAAAGSTEEVARRAGVGIATIFRHFPTKDELIEAALLRHFDQLTERAYALAAGTDPTAAWRTLVRAMIETGATKLTLASMLADRGGFPESAATASNRLKAAVGEVLRQAQDTGAVRPSVTVEEVYLLIRGLAQASATMQAQPDTLDRAIDVVLTGLSPLTCSHLSQGTVERGLRGCGRRVTGGRRPVVPRGCRVTSQLPNPRHARPPAEPPAPASACRTYVASCHRPVLKIGGVHEPGSVQVIHERVIVCR